MLLTISYSKSTIAPVELLKATLYDHFGNSVYIVYFILRLKLSNARKLYDVSKTPKGRLKRTRSVLKPRSASQRSGLLI